MKSLKEKIERRRVIKANGCWETTYKHSRPTVSLGRKQKNLRISRVAHELYLGPIPEGMLVCHTCDNPRCHNPEHLFLGTHSDNSQDMWNKGRKTHSGYCAQPGEKHHGAKLTKKQAGEIRSSAKKGHVLAAQYAVSDATISRIRHGHSWKQEENINAK